MAFSKGGEVLSPVVARGCQKLHGMTEYQGPGGTGIFRKGCSLDDFVFMASDILVVDTPNLVLPYPPIDCRVPCTITCRFCHGSEAQAWYWYIVGWKSFWIGIGHHIYIVDR